MQLAFPRESNPNFPWEKSHWDNTVVKSKKKKVSPALAKPSVGPTLAKPSVGPALAKPSVGPL